MKDVFLTSNNFDTIFSKLKDGFRKVFSVAKYWLSMMEK